MAEYVIFPGFNLSPNKSGVPLMLCSRLKKSFNLSSGSKISTDYIYYGIDGIDHVLYSFELRRYFKTKSIGSCFVAACVELSKLHPNMTRKQNGKKLSFCGNDESLYNICRTNELNKIVNTDELFDILQQIHPTNEDIITIESFEDFLNNSLIETNYNVENVVNHLVSMFQEHFNMLIQKYNVHPRRNYLTLPTAINEAINILNKPYDYKFLVGNDIIGTLKKLYRWKPSIQQVVEILTSTGKWEHERKPPKIEYVKRRIDITPLTSNKSLITSKPITTSETTNKSLITSETTRSTNKPLIASNKSLITSETRSTSNKPTTKPITTNETALKPTAAGSPKINNEINLYHNQMSSIELYKQQLNFAYNSSSNDYVINTCFNAAVAIMTNTTIYQDLSLKDVEQFEESINWENECDDESDEDFNKPFITHLNLDTHTFISSFMADDERQISKAYQGITTMNDIAKRYNYTYLIALSESIPRIMKLCQRLAISEQNIIIIDENVIKTLYISNRHQIESKQKQNLQLLNSSVYSLREYQQEYIEWMNNNPRSILKLPCGMGKSLIMIYHMMTHEQLSVVLVPNIALVEQFYININKFYKGFNHELPEIHRLSTKDKELVITSPTKQQIIISVYNSFVQFFIQSILTKRTNNDTNSILSFNRFPYIYIDEAHHVILPSNKKQKENIICLLNEYEKLRNSQSTANDEDENDFIEQINSLPNYGRTFSSLLYVFSYSYCDHSYYFSATIEPSNFSKYNMFAAISEGYLCRLNVDLIIDENYNQANITPERKINNLVSYLKNSTYQSIIIYTSRCMTARTICQALENSHFSSAVITAKMNPIERQANFDKFRNHELRCLLTVNCISEGVDLPNADTAIFFDEKRSIINIIQCVGRVMRLCEGKLSATLVIPAYNDDDIDNLYKNILTVINGELGYGNVDLRRILSVKFNGQTKSKIEYIKHHVNCKIYEYNEEYFSKISVWNKIRRCAYFYYQTHEIPTLNMTGPKAYMADGSYFDLQQFVHDNLYLDNLAGRELRKLYDIH